MVDGVTITKAIILAGGDCTRMDQLVKGVHKSVLPVADVPNIVLLMKQLEAAGVRNFYISIFSNPDSIRVRVNDAMKAGMFHSDTRVRYRTETRMMDTTSAAWSVYRRYSSNMLQWAMRGIMQEGVASFSDDEHVFVTACDMLLPGQDLRPFIKNYSYARQRAKSWVSWKSEILGAIGFIVRPPSDFIDAHPSADIDSRGRILKIDDEPPKSEEAAMDRYQSTLEHENLARFQGATGMMGLPFPTFYFILSTKALRLMAKRLNIESRMTGRMNPRVDFMRDAFKALEGNLRAIFFEEPIVNGKLLRTYYDMNTPSDFFRAQWMFLHSGIDLRWGYQKDIERGSWLAIGGVPKIHSGSTVRNCLIGRGVQILPGCNISDSVIGEGCRIANATIKGSVLMPYTHVNYYGGGRTGADIEYSIVGNGMRRGTLFDEVSLGITNIEEEGDEGEDGGDQRRHQRTLKLSKEMAIPGRGGMIKISGLPINGQEIALTSIPLF